MKTGACVVFRLGIIALAFAAGSAALAQGSYPNRPVRIVVGFAPGGPSDIISRTVGAKMGELMGAQFVVENKTGAAGVLATQEVARAAPDGYTLLNTPLATVSNEFLSKTIKYEYGKDIIAIGPQAETANILVVHPSLGVNSVPDLIKLAREEPGKLQYATAAGYSPLRSVVAMLGITVAGMPATSPAVARWTWPLKTATTR